MKWYGLSGGLGCGKSLVTEMIRKEGFPVVDADRIVHHMYETNVELHEEIKRLFGPDVFVDNKPVRRLIADHIKKDKTKKLDLEKFIHPVVQAKVKEIKTRLEKNKAKMAFYDVPLLFENKLQHTFTATVFIYSPLHLIYDRLQKRNAWSKEEVDIRLSWLLPNEEKMQLADHVIINDSSVEELHVKVKELVRILL